MAKGTIMNIEVRNIILDLKRLGKTSGQISQTLILNSRRVAPLFCRSTTIRCKVCTCFSYLFSIISTASKNKRTLQKLGVRSGTDPGMNRCTENISHGGDHGHVIRSRQLIYTAGLSLRREEIDLLF